MAINTAMKLKEERLDIIQSGPCILYGTISIEKHHNSEKLTKSELIIHHLNTSEPSMVDYATVLEIIWCVYMYKHGWVKQCKFKNFLQIMWECISINFSISK